ncbi:hypothetical protein FKM82_013177 [Ascaphus truei]
MSHLPKVNIQLDSFQQQIWWCVVSQVCTVTLINSPIFHLTLDPEEGELWPLCLRGPEIFFVPCCDSGIYLWAWDSGSGALWVTLGEGYESERLETGWFFTPRSPRPAARGAVILPPAGEAGGG